MRLAEPAESISAYLGGARVLHSEVCDARSAVSFLPLTLVFLVRTTGRISLFRSKLRVGFPRGIERDSAGHTEVPKTILSRACLQKATARNHYSGLPLFPNLWIYVADLPPSIFHAVYQRQPTVRALIRLWVPDTWWHASAKLRGGGP